MLAPEASAARMNASGGGLGSPKGPAVVTDRNRWPGEGRQLVSIRPEAVESTPAASEWPSISGRGGVRVVAVEEVLDADPALQTIQNLNTPADYHEALAEWLREAGG